MAAHATEATPLRHASSESWLGDVAFRARLLTVVASLAEGYDIGVANGVIAPMQSEFGFSNLEVAFLVASTPFASAFAAPCAGYFADRLGRKPTIAISCLLLTVGNLCWAFGMNFWLILVGRITLGAGIGVGLTTISIFMSEIAPAKKRGLYVSLEEIFLNIGIFCAFVAGAVFLGMPYDWRLMVGVGIIPCSVCGIFTVSPLFPESPRFLQAHGRTAEARQVLLTLLHGDAQEVDMALAKWEEEAHLKTKDWSATASALCGSHAKSARAALGTGGFQMLGGSPLIAAFMAWILIRSGMSSRDAATASVILGLVKTSVLFISVFVLLDLWGRRPLLMLSAFCGALAHAFVALVYHTEIGALWVAVGLILWAVSFSMGLGPVTYPYVSEVFDNSIRAKGVGLTFFVSRMCNAVSSFAFPLMQQSFGLAAVFVILACINLSAVVFFWLCCPETKGYSLEDIQSEVFRQKA